MKRLTPPHLLMIRWICLLVFSITIICCSQTEKCSSELTCAQLDSIETVMFKHPNWIDSLLQRVDTTDITEYERARIQTCQGLYFNEKGQFDRSIATLVKAEAFFIKENDEYHVHINRLIRAFAFEQLKLYNEAAKLFIQCDNYFHSNDYKSLKFYSSLGLLRLYEYLKFDKEEQKHKLRILTSELNDEYYNAVLYASMGNVEGVDSVKVWYYQRAKEFYKKVRRWSGVYSMDFNILRVRYRMNNWQEIKGCDTKSFSLGYVYEPTPHQQLRSLYLKASVLGHQQRNKEALVVIKKVHSLAIKLRSAIEEVNSLKVLAILYNRLGDYEQAYQMERQYIAAKDRQEEALNKSQLIALGANYRFTELEREALDSKLKASNFQVMLLVLVILLLAAFWIGWHLVRSKENERKTLVQQNADIENNLQKVNEELQEEKTEKNNLVNKLKVEKMKSVDSDKLTALLSDISNDHINSWIAYEKRFYELLPNYVDRLKQEWPNLTSTEIRYCMCFYFNLENYVVSKLTGNSVNGVKSAKTRLRKKLELETISELYLALKKIE
ncbi:tetratricopeptide repeat protein [Puteibacter caeruleilacunae]|nr:tetratricopeptide repeat protein [Puteibacter caeruleilacunae]